MYTAGSHQCPAPGCSERISNRIFACRPHWGMLFRKTQRDIYDTAALPVIHPDRLEVIRRAAREWERAGLG